MELGDLENTVRRFAEMLGWSSEIEELMKSQETGVSSLLITRPLNELLQVMKVKRGKWGDNDQSKPSQWRYMT